MMSRAWIDNNYVIVFTDGAIVSFMNYFRTNFSNETISPKLLGMSGELGVESIQRRFNTTYSSIRNKSG